MRKETITATVRDIPWMAEAPSDASTDPDDCKIAATSNIRAVGFIAKPHAVNELSLCIEGRLINLLRGLPGFSGSMILYSHKELRSVTLLSFWKTEAQAMDTCWEDFSAVCDLVYPLVDACTKVQTFHSVFVEHHGDRRNGVM